MKDLPPLKGFSSEEKDALIRELWQMVQALQAEVESLVVQKTFLSLMMDDLNGQNSG